MITPEIIRYIKQQITLGVSREMISASLKQNGWNDADVNEAFNSLANPVINTVPQAAPVVTRSSHMVRNIVIFIILLALLGGAGWWWFYGRRAAPITQNEAIKSSTEAEKPKTESFDDLKITYVPVPAEENSALIFNSVAEGAVTQEDRDFFTKFLKDNQVELRPINESKKVLVRHKKLLETFEAGVAKKYYRCSLSMGDTCNLSNLRSAAMLAAVNSFVLLKDGKPSEAQDYARKIIKLGQMLTERADDFLTLLAGWEVQKIGYYAFKDAGGNALSLPTKDDLVKNLREEHKKLLKLDYSRALEVADFIKDKNKKPSVLIKESDETMNELRKDFNDISWKPEVVKKWFADSLKIDLANVDLACGVKPKEGKVDTGFNPFDTPETENFLGKKFYSYVYISLNSAHTKRCELEKLINSL